MSEWLERFLYRHADQVVINSPGFDDHVKSRGARQVTLIPTVSMWICSPRLQIRSRFREQQGLQDAFVVIYAGAHGLSNDLGIVLDAAEILSEEKKIRFVMVGDGKEKPELVQARSQMHLNNVSSSSPGQTRLCRRCSVLLMPAWPSLNHWNYTRPRTPIKCLITWLPGCRLYWPSMVSSARLWKRPVAVFSSNPEIHERWQPQSGTWHSHPDQARRMGQAGCRYIRSQFQPSGHGYQIRRITQEIEVQGDRQNTRRRG